MTKLTLKIAFPIIAVGVFAIMALTAILTDYHKLSTSFYIVSLFLAVFVFSSGLAIGQRLSSPVKAILDKAVELSKGNLSSRVYLESKDELAELAKILNQLAEELQVSRDLVAKAEQSVSIKVKARTQDLEETINALEQKVRNRTIELEKIIKESGQKTK
jgi:nitrogen fixation/metabolism regulation signal transduction histidine kinase